MLMNNSNMNLKIAFGIALFILGTAMIPFGWWVARIYGYVGGFISGLGAVIALMASSDLKRDNDVICNEPEFPLSGGLRGFKGREILDRHDIDSSDSAD